MKKSILMLSALCVVIFSCHHSPQENACSGSATTFQLNDPFTLCWGNTATQTGPAGLVVKFSKLVEDSRCPADVECIRAGSATVELVLTKGTESLTDTLSIGDDLLQISDSAFFQTYQIKLLDVLPAPVSSATTPEDQYKVKLLITQ